MAIQVPSPRFIAARRRALAVLANSPDGLTREELLHRGFMPRVFGHLLITGLATAHAEGRGKPTHLRITEAGRAAMRRRAGEVAGRPAGGQTVGRIGVRYRRGKRKTGARPRPVRS